MKRQILFILTAVLLLTAACDRGQALVEPPDIHYGEDICDECSMIINESRYAAAYVTVKGTVYHFDDVGDMLAHNAEHLEDIHIYWVHDFNTEVWVKADEATFVFSEETMTPMGWGLLAFAQKKAAAQFITANGGVIIEWADLQTAVAVGDLHPDSRSAPSRHPHDEMEHHDVKDAHLNPKLPDDQLGSKEKHIRREEP